MKRVGWVLMALASLAAVVYASIFPIAEIFTEVVILRTYGSDGAPHETRVTVIDRAGEPWVRGRPYRGWFRRIEAHPEAELYRARVSQVDGHQHAASTHCLDFADDRLGLALIVMAVHGDVGTCSGES